MTNKKKEIKDTAISIKVKALSNLIKIGYAYVEGDEFELKTGLANDLIKDGLVEKCGK